MGYASPLETRIAKKVTKAITEYSLIEDGDRVMVGLSGGKDSWALLQILDVLRQRAPITFTLIGVTVDSGYDGYRHDLISRTCDERAWDTGSSTPTLATSWTISSRATPRHVRCAPGFAAACCIGSRPKSAPPTQDRSPKLSTKVRPRLAPT